MELTAFETFRKTTNEFYILTDSGGKYLRIETKNFTAIFDRKFLGQNLPDDFLRRIDDLSQSSAVLKNGNTSCVRHLNWNGQEIVIKRYNHKGIINSFRQTIKGSWALKCWSYGHILFLSGIAAPRPLAYIEKKKSGLVWKSYFVTEHYER